MRNNRFCLLLFVLVALSHGWGVRALLAECQSPPGQCAELVKPAQRDAERWTSARCNDGTPWAFFHRPPATAEGAQIWVVYLDGGGYCDDNSKPCQERALFLTTTVAGGDGGTVDFPNPYGIFSLDQGDNPTFHDAHHVWGHYCSSDAWGGATTTRRPSSGDPIHGWYFSGRANARALFEVLIDEFALDDSDPLTRVLFTGGSAGGAGVKANADTAVELLPRTAAAGRLKLVADASWLQAFDDPQHRLEQATDPDLQVIRDAYDFHGAQLEGLCEAAQTAAGGHRGDCLLGEVVYPFLTDPPPAGLGLPFFVQQSTLDSVYLAGHGIEINDPADAAAVVAWQGGMLSSLTRVAWLFSGGRPSYHTILHSPTNFALGPEGRTLRDQLARFWSGAAPERVLFDTDATGGACSPAATMHCLQDGRFQVEVVWKDYAGTYGDGQTVPGAAADSGLFTFFNPANWEMLVKVLDGCPVNDRFWVFAASATTVEFQLRVTDTTTGEVRLYTNPLGVAATAIADAAAFATCDDS